MLKKLLTKSLLVMAGLCVGSSAWAGTETYNFESFIGGLNGAHSVDNTSIVYKKISNQNLTWLPDFNKENFSENWRTNAAPYAFVNVRFASQGNFYLERGSGGYYMRNKQTGARYFTIANLSVGDIVTFTVNGTVTFVSTNAKLQSTDAAVAVGDNVTSAAYVITAAGDLDLSVDKSGTYSGFKKIVITTVDDLTGPTITMTGASGVNRIITLSGGSTSEEGASITSYRYTTDGSIPSATNGTVYDSEAKIVISETSTIKAVAISSTGKASTFTSSTVEAGTLLNLAEATVTHSGNGKYTIASDQSAIFGTPSATIHYQVDGGAEQTSTNASVDVNIATDGTLTYWLTATGYNSTTPQNETVYAPVAYAVTTTLDFRISDNDNSWATYGAAFGEGVAIPTDDTDHTYYKYYNLAKSETIGEGLLAVTQNYTNSEKGFWGWRVAKNNGGVYPYNSTEYVALLDLTAGQIVQVEGVVPTGTTNLTIVPAGTYTNMNTYTVTADGDAFFSLAKGNSIKTIKLCDATVSAPIVSSTGYATFSSKYALDFTGITALTAYTATSYNGTSVTLTPVTGTVAANTGLVIKGVTTDIPTVATGDAQDGNLLQPCDGSWTTLSKSSTGTNYVLSVQDETVVFAPIDAVSATLRAGSAYLYVPTSTGAKLRLVFGDDATAINGIESEKNAENGAIYNLAGQRVNAGYKGIVIKNGKKFMNK